MTDQNSIPESEIEIEVTLEQEQDVIGTVCYAGPRGEIAELGSVILFAGSTIPNNWLECNGQAISRSLYSNLFNIIGISYGEGDGETTFNVPSLVYSIHDPGISYIIKSL